MLMPDEYLRLEAESSVKHKYMDGQVLAIGGDGTTTPNLVALRRGYVRGTRCRVYIADMKVVRVEAQNCFYYPDVVATNDASDAKTSTYKYFPQLIVELLPALTKVFDRGGKFTDHPRRHP
jgi:Uma2 family endonuclease